ncbi:MAG: adaptor protein MecA [Oscillospiraceae bacterium]|jgi:hypothetical protein|nr:adaptor protein MecA [Oscillospiraceae bacterium]
MRIEAITRRKIVVELSAEDMDSLDITYEALDYSSVETRRVIWILLSQVREITGCDIDPSGQLLIDAMPRPTGGCILFFTIRGGCAEPFGACAAERVMRKQDQLLIAFEFESVDALLDCAAAYARTPRGETNRLLAYSELYSDQLKYRLLACPAQDLAAVKQFFSEYALCCGEDSFAADHTREYWKKLGEGQIFELLGGGKEPPRQTAAIFFAPGNVYSRLQA